MKKYLMKRGSLVQEIERLENKLLVAESDNTSRLKVSRDKVRRLGFEKYMASGLIVEVKNLSGECVFGPVMIADGFSDKLIQAFIEDINRSINMKLSFLGIEGGV